MYDVVVYDEGVHQFVPVRDGKGKRISFDSWADASDFAIAARLAEHGEYKVEYRTIRTRRKK